MYQQHHVTRHLEPVRGMHVIRELHLDIHLDMHLDMHLLMEEVHISERKQSEAVSRIRESSRHIGVDLA